MIYGLRFSRPIGNPDKKHGTAQHYLGWCEDNRLEERIAEHRAGRGAKITQAAIKQGAELELVFILPGGTRDDERRLKRIKNHRKVFYAQVK